MSAPFPVLRGDRDLELNLLLSCPRCEGSLSFHQPDIEVPDRLLATCDDCKAWYVSSDKWAPCNPSRHPSLECLPASRKGSHLTILPDCRRHPILNLGHAKPIENNFSAGLTCWWHGLGETHQLPDRRWRISRIFNVRLWVIMAAIAVGAIEMPVASWLANTSPTNHVLGFMCGMARNGLISIRAGGNTTTLIQTGLTQHQPCQAARLDTEQTVI